MASLASRLSAHVNRLEAVRALKVVKIYDLLSRVAKSRATDAIGNGKRGKKRAAKSRYGRLRWMRHGSPAAVSTRSVVADVTEYFERAADGLVEEAEAATAQAETGPLYGKGKHKGKRKDRNGDVDRVGKGKGTDSESSDATTNSLGDSQARTPLPFMDSGRYKELLRGDIRGLVGHEAMLSRNERENAQALAHSKALSVPPRALLTPRAVASILHGLSSPRFGLDQWGNTRYWRLHRGFRFADIVQEARAILRAKTILSRGGL